LVLGKKIKKTLKSIYFKRQTYLFHISDFGHFELLFSNFFNIKNNFELSPPLCSTQIIFEKTTTKTTRVYTFWKTWKSQGI
jgi:hypothetical protein